jgi:putative ABC transport system permease protein
VHLLRTFRREPTFVSGVVLTFALAVGVNAAMFGLVEQLMFAPPPGVEDAGRVVRVAVDVTGFDGQSYSMSTMSYPAFRSIAGVDRAFVDAAAARTDTMTTGRGAELSEVAVVQASGRYFAVLGARPIVGRFFGPPDDELPAGNDVVVLSHAYWRRHFAGDASVLGRQIVVDDRPFTVIGVAARGFNGDNLSAVDLFMPISAASRDRGSGWFSNPGMRVVTVIARLRDGITLAAARDAATSTMRDGAAAAGDDGITFARLESLLPGESARQSTQSRIALWLSGVSLVVLLIATANVGTLLLLRAARRRRDVAVRIALGAGHARLARESLAESLLLALAGAAVGLLLARWFSQIVRVTLLPHVATTDRLVDGKVLLASLVAAVGAGLLAGLSPLVQLRRRNLSVDLRTGGHGTSGRFVVQHGLVAVQVALCTVLLVGAGLFVRSLQRVQSQDLGFSTAHLLYASLEFRGRVPGPDRDLVHDEAVRRLSTLAGVTGVTVVQGMPFSSHHIPPISIPGVPSLINSGGQIPIMYGATPAYLDMMGVTLREGRLFTERDQRGSPLVVLVNETMARTVWPNDKAIGKCVRAGHGASFSADPEAGAASTPCREVVGVVRDSRARSLRLVGNEDKLMQYYVPFGQLPAPPVPSYGHVHAILVRSAGDPEKLAAPVQRLIQSASTRPVYARVRPYQDRIDPQLRSWRLGATLFSAFGILALGIASVGLFAVISYLVTQRTQEIGVRLALGGTGSRIAGRVVSDAVRMSAAGAVVGVVVAVAGAPLVQSLLFQISPRDPMTIVTAVATLLAVAVGAAALPAWRASRVSPMRALRTDA